MFAITKLSNWARNYKFTYSIYNLLHRKELAHNKAAYKKYGIKKPLHSPISHADFKHLPPEYPWLDHPNDQLVAQQIEEAPLEEATKNLLRQWRRDGYLIISQFFDAATIDALNQEVANLLQKGEVQLNPWGKIMFANKQSPLINNITRNQRLQTLLSCLLGKEVLPFQTINFIHGSQQRAHSDSIHMTTHPLGYLSAAWIALEEITEQNGPLFYYPGSHRLPYLMNDAYPNHNTRWQLDPQAYKHYEDKLEQIIATNQLKRKTFCAQKGDVLIWHANLIHGGSPIIDPQSTRKSMVIHFYAKDVIKYHELTERPTLIGKMQQ